MGLIEYLNCLQHFQRCSDEYLNRIGAYFSDYYQSPKFLCKYLDFDGGFLSLINSNLQFSCPLKFHRTVGRLSDSSELSLARLFVDDKTQTWLLEYFEKHKLKERLHHLKGFEGKIGYLFYCYLTEYIQRQGISCLTERPDNEYLWEHAASNSSGICIEYNTEIINSFSDNDTLCARVAYFDNIEPVDFQFISKQPLYKHFLFNLFFVKKNTYKREEEFRIIVIFRAIDRLNIDENFVIVYCGLGLDHFINYLQIPYLSKDKYRDIKIYKIRGSSIVRDSLFIIHKNDLPNISTISLDQEIIDKYSLKKISESLELYASVTDMNLAKPELFNEHLDAMSEEQLRKSVLVSVFIVTEYKWKKNIKVVQLKIDSEFDQRGVANKLEDVLPFVRY